MSLTQQQREMFSSTTASFSLGKCIKIALPEHTPLAATRPLLISSALVCHSLPRDDWPLDHLFIQRGVCVCVCFVFSPLRMQPAGLVERIQAIAQNVSNMAVRVEQILQNSMAAGRGLLAFWTCVVRCSPIYFIYFYLFLCTLFTLSLWSSIIIQMVACACLYFSSDALRIELDSHGL